MCFAITSSVAVQNILHPLKRISVCLELFGSRNKTFRLLDPSGSPTICPRVLG
jgi:hypothetical protein